MAADRAGVLAWIRRSAEAIHEQREILTELDHEIGDGDHGTNMDRGFAAVMTKLPDVADADIGTILKTVGMTLVSTVGGASGPLYGTAFLRAGTALAGKQELTLADALAGLQAALDGVVARGHAERGEKTMVDAIAPAVDALKASVEHDDALRQALETAATAAEDGAKATIPMLAKKGRASYLGERSINHQDPGATSAALFFRAMVTGE